MSEQGRTAADAETAIRNWLIYREEQHTEDDLQLVLAELERLSKAWGEARAALARRDTTIAAVRKMGEELAEAAPSIGIAGPVQRQIALTIRGLLSAPVEAGTPAAASQLQAEPNLGVEAGAPAAEPDWPTKANGKVDLDAMYRTGTVWSDRLVEASRAPTDSEEPGER